MIWKTLPNEVVMFWGGIGTIITPFVTEPWIGIEMKIINNPESMSKSNQILSKENLKGYNWLVLIEVGLIRIYFH